MTRWTTDDVYPEDGVRCPFVLPDGKNVHLVEYVTEAVAGTGGNESAASQSISTRTQTKVQIYPIDGGLTKRVFTTAGTFTHCVPSNQTPCRLALCGGETAGLTVTNLEYSSHRRIFDRPVLISRLADGDEDLGMPRWAPDDASIVVCSQAGDAQELTVVSADGSHQRRILRWAGDIVAWDWSPTGTQISVIVRNLDATTGRILVVGVPSGEIVSAWDEPDFEYGVPAARWLDQSILVVRSNRSGWSKLWLCAADGTTSEPITRGEWDEYSFRIGKDGRIIFVSRCDQQGGGDDLWLISHDHEALQRITNEDGVHSLVGWSGHDSMVYRWSAPQERDALCAVSATGKAVRAMRISTALQLRAKVIVPEVVAIPGNGGVLEGLFYAAALTTDGNSKRPGIVWIHGGPTSRSSPGWNPFPAWLAREGFAVLTVNYRGSTGYGVGHMNAVAGPGVGLSDLADILSAATWLKEQPEVNTARGLGVGGRSWGGYLALRAGTTAPDAFSCIYAGSAIADWRIQQSHTEVRYYDHWLLGGWVYEQGRLAIDRSPIEQVDSLAAPLLITHGRQDRDVPFDQIEQFVSKARALGKNLECVFHEQEGHSTRLPENRRLEMRLISRFFRTYLQEWDFVETPSGSQTAN